MTLSQNTRYDEKQKQYGPVYTYLRTRLDRAVYMDHGKGDIYILNIKNLTKQEITLLSFLSKRYIQDINEFLCVDDKSDDSSIELIDTKEKELEEENAYEE